MRISTSRRQLVAGIAAVALAVAALVALVVQHSHRPSTGATSSGAVTIPAAGGAQLSAQIYAPSSTGQHPLVVMPGSWGSQATEYATVANNKTKIKIIKITK